MSSKLAHFRYVAFYDRNELKRTLGVIKTTNLFEVYDGKEDINWTSVRREFTNQFIGF